MSARRLVVPLIAMSSVFYGQPARADFGKQDDAVYAIATESADATNVDSDSAARGPRCSWERATVNETHIGGGLVEGGSGEMPWYVDANGNEATGPGPGIAMLYEVRCPYGTGPAHLEYALPADQIDRQAVIQAAYDEAVRTIPLPTIDIAPSPEIRGIVNVGMWMAVDDPGQVNAFASVGPVWASVTARFTGTTWEMGNGDVVTCDGLGVPYTGGPADDFSAGPCGYTYTASGTYGVRAVGRWEIQAVTSDGDNLMLEPSNRAFDFEYPVIEYVTTGHP